MKKPKSVVAAKSALALAKAALDDAKDALQQREQDYLAAYKALRAAQTDADASLPQCRHVCVRYGGRTVELDRVAILRRNSGGMLIVRPIGAPDGQEFRFKWSGNGGVFRLVEKGSWRSDTHELRDVPAEYLPPMNEAN